MPLFLALDGLSSAGLYDVAARSPGLHALVNSRKIISLSGTAVPSPHAAWSELLTGKTWYEAGCPGFAVPTDNLAQLKEITRERLRCQTITKDNALFVNVPIVGTSNSSRSTELEIAAGSPPVRFFAEMLHDPQSTIAAIVQADCANLSLSLSLVKENPSTMVLTRILAFDLLARLLGPRFTVEIADSRFANLIDPLFQSLNSFIENTASSCPEDGYFLGSLYEIVECKAQINLNAVLIRAGLLKSITSDVLEPQEQRRRTAMNLLSLSHQFRQMESQYNIAASQAVSPIAGCIYINRKRQFGKRSLADEDCTIAQQIESAVIRRMKNYGLATKSTRFNHPEPAMPDIVCQIEGGDFNYHGREDVQLNSHPRGCYQKGGFLLSGAGLADVATPALNTGQLGQILAGI